MKKCLKTIIVFLGLTVFATIGISEAPSVGPAPKRKVRRTRRGEESKIKSPKGHEESEEDSIIYYFPEEKPVPMSKADSIESAQRLKEMIKRKIQEYKPKVEDNIKFLEESFDKPLRRGIGPAMGVLGWAFDLRGLPVLSKVVLHNPLPHYRRYAIQSIVHIERYNKDTNAVPVLRKVLKDSNIFVQFEAARGLLRLAEEAPSTISTIISILSKIAKGENQENWVVPYISGADHRTEEEIEKYKEEIRDHLRRRAIMGLGYLSVKKENKECSKLLEELRQMPEIRKKFLRALERIRQNYRIDSAF